MPVGSRGYSEPIDMPTQQGKQMNIKLNFVNQAALVDADLPTLLLFQKQHDEHGNAHALIWKVIRRCRYQHFRPLNFSGSFNVSLGDHYGNYSRLVPAQRGDHFAVEDHDGHRRIAPERRPHAAQGIAVRNDLHDGVVDACLFVRGDLLARHRRLAPSAHTGFELDTLWIGATPRDDSDELVAPHFPGRRRPWHEGGPVGERVLRHATAIDLAGVAGANIVMRSSPTGLIFNLEDVVMTTDV